MNSNDVQTAYRVVRVLEDGTLTSVVAYKFNGWSVEHKLGQWTRPNIKQSLLFVFDTKDNALSWAHKIFLSKGVAIRVYSCHVKGLKPLIFYCMYPDLWRQFWQHSRRISPEPTPLGTKGAEAVKLLKQVGPD